MYNLSLPVNIFGRKGFYTLFIRPKEIYCTIKDVGALGAYPDISGIIVDMNSINTDRSLFGSDNLTGYRVEYLQYEDGRLRRQNYYRLITSCNFAEPITQNLTSANTNSNAYRFNESGTLSFITLTPSIATSFKPNAKPYIGSPNQQIKTLKFINNGSSTPSKTIIIRMSDMRLKGNVLIILIILLMRMISLHNKQTHL